MSSWVDEEIVGVDLGDERLNKRAATVLNALGSHPGASIPAACGGWSETQAAYRFFANDKCTPESVLQPHREATLRRCAEHETVLLVNDSSELDYSSMRGSLRGVGPLNFDERVGIHIHPLIAFSRERLCLGTVHWHAWARDELGSNDDRQSKPIEEKESFRWLVALRHCYDIGRERPGTRFLYVADCECDIFECFVEADRQLDDLGAVPSNVHWLIRSRMDRRNQRDRRGEESWMWESVASAVELGRVVVRIERSGNRPARDATVALRAVRFSPRSPYRPGGRPPAVEISVVAATEVDAPAGIEPIDWILLTDQVVETFAEAARTVADYACRFSIETVFKVLKSGCGVEKLQFESADRLSTCLAMYLIVAWRVLFAMRLGRECPELPCDALFDESEWRSVYHVVAGKPAPQDPPPLGEMLTMIAELGGHLNRRGDGPPGPKTMWIGMQRTADYSRAWEAFGPPVLNARNNRK